MSNLTEYTKEILSWIISEEGSTDLQYSEIKAYMEELSDNLEQENDFIFEFEGVEHRIIHNSVIDEIALEEIEDSLKECYHEVNKLLAEAPPYLFISVDWEQSAQYCLDADGYGHHFNHWNGEEKLIGPFYIFRLGA